MKEQNEGRKMFCYHFLYIDTLRFGIAHVCVCVCTRSTSSLKDYMQLLSLQFSIRTWVSSFIHYRWEDNEKRKLYGYFSVNIVRRSWMVVFVRVSMCVCVAHLVCNVFTCLSFVNTHHLNDCCCCCCWCLDACIKFMLDEAKTKDAFTWNKINVYASTTANTTFSLLPPLSLPSPSPPPSSSSL